MGNIFTAFSNSSVRCNRRRDQVRQPVLVFRYLQGLIQFLPGISQATYHIPITCSRILFLFRLSTFAGMVLTRSSINPTTSYSGGPSFRWKRHKGQVFDSLFSTASNDVSCHFPRHEKCRRDGLPFSFAQRPLPSMMMAICLAICFIHLIKQRRHIAQR